MADGEWCTNHLDCCLEYVKDGVKRCDCGAEAGCEEARLALGATRVDWCAARRPRGTVNVPPVSAER